MNNAFSYKDSKNVTHTAILKEDLYNQYKQAMDDYETSRTYIQSHYYYSWRYAYKSYHMSTEDRKQRLKNHSLNNFHFGYSRAFVDVFASTLSERPIVFNATPYDAKAIENKDNVVSLLSTIADMTEFNRESKKILTEGLKTGTFAVRIGYMPPATPVKYRYFFNNSPVDMEYTPEI